MKDVDCRNDLLVVLVKLELIKSVTWFWNPTGCKEFAVVMPMERT